MERLVSLLGIPALLVLTWLMSAHRRVIPWRVIVGGIALQFAIAGLIFYTPPGEAIFEAVRDVFLAIIGCVDEGTRFVFGPAVLEAGSPLNNFAFRALPIIIFFSALMSLLYYFGVMQWVIRGLAWLMRKTLRTSAAETLATAANVFVGQTEAPLVIRPYVAAMTQSELMALMVGGFATVAGSVMATYVTVYQIDAGHILTASVMSAPAALVVAKLMQPEVDVPRTLEAAEVSDASPAVNAIHAVTLGAGDGLKLALNVGAMIIAFLALIALVNLTVAWLGGQAYVAARDWFGYSSGASPFDWKLEYALGYVFAPLAWLMGTEPADCLKMGELLGIKMVGNEFLGYERLHEMMQGGELSARSKLIATYALCGFANFGSIGIQIGGIGPLAPDRRGDLARLGFRAMLGGTLAACMTANVAGVLL